MNSTSPSAFALSATLHAVLIALALLVGHATSQSEKPLPIIELVAGVGDNYMATEAPKLGTEGGVKVDIPKAPEPKPTPPAPTPAPPEPEPVPVTPAPQPPKTPPQTVTPVPKAQDTIPDFKKQLKQDSRIAVNKAKREIAKERAAEKKRAEEEKKRMSKEEFDRANKQKSATPPSKSVPRKVAQIDVLGISKGVVDGSVNNRKGGAGGTALTSAEVSAVDRYEAFLLQRLREELDREPGLDDGLRAEAEFRVAADGRLTHGRIMKTSRNKEFDEAVLRAIAAVRLPSRPKGFAEQLLVPFTTEAKK